jgi:micrococcal nuclease
LALLIAVLSCVAHAATAAELPAALAVAEQVLAARAVDADAFALDDGRVVRLAGLLAPKPPPGREANRPWPIADDARRALDGLVAGRQIALAPAARKSDRYGRIVAHVSVDGLWVQGEMLARGLARVETALDDRAGAREMLALESTARSERRGLWRLDAYGVLNAARAGRFIDTFQLVEDKARWGRGSGGRGELQLGQSDGGAVALSFTAAARRELRAAGLDPRKLPDRTLRVRGWLRSRYGPAIEITHAEQIEVIDQ